MGISPQVLKILKTKKKKGTTDATQQIYSYGFIQGNWKKNLFFYHHKYLYMNIHRSMIHRTPKSELIQMSINRYMDKHIIEYIIQS